MGTAISIMLALSLVDAFPFKRSQGFRGMGKCATYRCQSKAIEKGFYNRQSDALLWQPNIIHVTKSMAKVRIHGAKGDDAHYTCIEKYTFGYTVSMDPLGISRKTIICERDTTSRGLFAKKGNLKCDCFKEEDFYSSNGEEAAADVGPNAQTRLFSPEEEIHRGIYDGSKTLKDLTVDITRKICPRETQLAETYRKGDDWLISDRVEFQVPDTSRMVLFNMENPQVNVHEKLSMYRQHQIKCFVSYKCIDDQENLEEKYEVLHIKVEDSESESDDSFIVSVKTHTLFNIF